MTLPRWFLRFFFQMLYYQMAWTYDAIAWLVSFGQWAAWRRTVIPNASQGPILELAFGTGGLAVDLARAGLNSAGLDLSPFMARLARQRVLKNNVPLRLLQGQAQCLPFRDKVFANVIATFPTDFILDPQTLASVQRVLQPDGLLLIVVMGYLEGPRPFRKLVEWAYRVTGQRQVPHPDPIIQMNQAGYDARWEDVSWNGVTARLLIASRPKSPSSQLN